MLSIKTFNSMVISLIVLLGFSSHAWSDALEPIKLGIVPQQNATKLAIKWRPLIKHIEKETGLIVQFHTARDIPTFESRLLKGEYDFAYMNPYHYIVANKVAGYNAIAKAKDKKLKGIIVVKKSADIKSLEQLDNSRLALPAPGAFAASLVTQSEFDSRNIKISPVFVSSHDSVYRSVTAGLFPAGGGVIRTFKSMEDNIRNELKVIWTSKGNTPHAIAHHPRVDQALVQKVAEAITTIEKSVMKGEIQSKLKIKGFERANDKEWDDIRQLRIVHQLGQ